MHTLQDVIDAAQAFPERYGTRAYFRYYRGLAVEAICPLAKEVLLDLLGTSVFDDPGRRAAARLQCPIEDVDAFTAWWDANTEGGRDATTEALRERGYTL